MDPVEQLQRAREAFRDELAQPPALTLRGANAVDSYDRPEPFDAALDEPTDEYVERLAFWAMPYLDARSWRHYLPRLIEYALAHPDDPAMVVESTVRSLRPPDRVPARLDDAVALRRRRSWSHSSSTSRCPTTCRDRAMTRRPRSRSGGSPARSSARRPSSRRRRVDRASTARQATGQYRITLPTTLDGGGVHHVAEENRAIEVWRGMMCGDAAGGRVRELVSARPPVVARAGGEREVLARAGRARVDRGARREAGAAPRRHDLSLQPRRARSHHDRRSRSPDDAVVTLTMRGTQRADVQAEMDRVIRSFRSGRDALTHRR